MTVAELATECRMCGGQAKFDGRTQASDGRVYAIAWCPQCRLDIPFWTPQTDERIAAFERVQMLHAIAKRLCNVSAGTAQEIRAALALPAAPAPLGASECEISAGVLSRASVKLWFSQPMLLRCDLDRVFGQAQVLPRSGAYASHKLVYDMYAAGAPACVAIFAAFRNVPQAASSPQDLLLRIDPARTEKVLPPRE